MANQEAERTQSQTKGGHQGGEEMKKWKIKQRHDDCHYETTITGKDPIRPFIAYGFSQEEADSKAINKLLKAELRRATRQ